MGKTFEHFSSIPKGKHNDQDGLNPFARMANGMDEATISALFPNESTIFLGINKKAYQLD
jgi:hypothetical protein